MFKSKRFLTLCLSLTLIMTFLLSCVVDGVKAYATSANGIISTYINMAAGKQLTDEDLSNINLSEKDLQFLGVYVSNFYVPFGTAWGLDDKSDLTTQNKEDITKALQSNLAFSDALATCMTEVIMNQVRNSSKELTICVSKKYQSDITELTAGEIPCNYFTVMSCMLGGMRQLVEKYKGDDTKMKNIQDGTYKYGYLAYKGTNSEGKSQYIPVFDFNIDMETITPSQAAFIKCLESVDLERGYGSNFFDFTSKELNDGSSYSDLNSSLSDEAIYSLSAYGEKLRVDCFGDILIMGANHQYVAVPGCMNPYNWVTVDTSGNDLGSIYGGTVYNLASIPSMSLYDAESIEGANNSMFTGGITSGESESATSNSVNEDISIALQDNFKNMKFGIFGLGRKTSESDFKKSLDYIIDYCGGSAVENNSSRTDFKITLKDGQVSVSGKASVLVSVDANKMSEDFLSSSSRNKEKADKMKSYIDNLVNNYKIPRKTLEANIKSISKQCTERLASGTAETVSSNALRADLRTDVLEGKLANMDEGRVDYSEDASFFNMRILRGDDSVEVNTFFGSSVKDLFNKASDVYKNTTGTVAYSTASNGFWEGETPNIGSYKYTGTKIPGSKTIDFVDSFIYLDTLGQFADSADYSLINVLSYTSGEHSAISSTAWGSSLDNGFTNMYNSIKNGEMCVSSDISAEAEISLYITYAFASLYDSSSAEEKAKGPGRLGYRITTNMPAMSDKALDIPESAIGDMELTSIRDWLYYLLHPTQGLSYFKVWVKNKVSSALLGWHDDMVGTNGTGSVNGTTRYRGVLGYVTTPSISDMPVTSTIMKYYKIAIPYIIIVLVVIMLIAYILGVLSLQKSFFCVVIFSVFLLVPPVLINKAVDTSNNVASSIYSDKFTYWALLQHESYSDEIDKYANGSSYESYLRTLYNENSETNANQGSETVMVRWQAPKKMQSLMYGSSDDSINGSIFKNNLLSGIMNRTYSGESYLDDKDSTYLYRSYIDIANASRYIHRGLQYNSAQDLRGTITNDLKGDWTDSLRTAMDNYDSNYQTDRNMGYANKNASGGVSGMTSDGVIRVIGPLSSSIVTEAYEKAGTLSSLTLDDYVGINQDAFNFSIPMFNKSTGLKYADVLESAKKSSTFSASKYSNSDYSGLACYGLMSESPFYYFSWDLYESGLVTEASASGDYKNLLLGGEDSEFFYNTQGNGELKDFMDMKSLFTYVIPYLKMGNDIVHEWDDTYGLFIYDGVPTEEGHENDADILNSTELKQKYWHNLNVARLYNIYTPWVDLMYECSYSKPETISVQGERVTINNPLDPASYPDNRPMVFSESEMSDYGLKESQLTKAEKKIISCEKDMQERMFKLLNYYNFNDVVLDTAASMECTFAFNTTFSESNLFGESFNIYPQSYQLEDFSYDAFLRYILSNATGDSMIVSESNGDDDGGFYSRIVKKSSLTTVIVMLVLDFLSMYVIPGLRVLTILCLFFLFLMLILTTLLQVDSDGKFFVKVVTSFLKPLVCFLLISIGMAVVVSLFMGEGNTAVTGSMKPSVTLGDPVIAMLAMVLVNGVVMYLYFKTLSSSWNDLKKHAKMAGGFVMGIAQGITGKLSATVSNVMSGSSGSGSGSSKSESNSSGVFSIGGANERAKSRGNASMSNVRDKEKSSNLDRQSVKRRKDINLKTSSGGSVSADVIDAKMKSGSSKIVESESSKEEKVEETK